VAGAAKPGAAPGAPLGASARRRVQSVLFVCNFNAVRSAAAEAIARHYFGASTYVQSAGVRSGEPTDPFMVSALDEIGIDASRHKPRTLDELEEWEGLNFDLIVSLSPEAHHAALELTRTVAAEVEYWPTADPTIVQGSREQRLDAYRDLRDGLALRVRTRLK
jgi:protein-tyrosine-phosphatase